jgi:RimJ/RimL family protein N-acetyltransferase
MEAMHLMQIPDSIQTSRLFLRGPLPDDLEIYQAALVESLPELRQWFFWAQETPTPAILDSFIFEAHTLFQKRLQLDWFIFLKETEAFIGVVTLHSFGTGTLDWSQTTQLLSYWLRSGYTGQGYMTEAASAIVDLAFSLPSISQLEIYTAPTNTRSAAVAKRLGFLYRETLQDDTSVEDRYVKER